MRTHVSSLYHALQDRIITNISCHRGRGMMIMAIMFLKRLTLLDKTSLGPT